MPSETYLNELATASIGLGTLWAFLKAGKTIASGVSKGINNQKTKTVYNMSSIAKASKDLTMSFPVLCSDTISPATASLITKAIERNNVSMLQMLIGAYHIRANNGLEAIKMVHTNMDNAFRAEDLIDAVVGTTDYFGGLYEASDIAAIINCKRPPINYARILEECRQEFLNTCNIRYPESNFSENAISDYIISSSYNNTTVLKELNTFNLDNAYNEDLVKRMEKMSQQERDQFNAYKDKMKFKYDKKKSDLDYFKAYQDWKNKKEDTAYKKERDKIEDEKDLIRSRRELFTKQLIDSDVKKANEVQPTLMVIPFYYEDSSGTEKSQEFIAGIKSRLITCTSEEIIDQISRFNKQGVNIINLIKATTKETSLAKDFIAGIDQAKIDAKRDSKLGKTSPIWRMLQGRASRSGIKRLIRIKDSKNAAAAITTLVITQQEADYIAENYNIDITNPVIAREFMENYNLLCLIIVDEQTEVAKFLYDGEKYFTDYSFTALDKENNSNDTRKLISLLNKTR